ncbi:MAG: hypothetical protein RLO04_10035 [Limnobacter sp.]|uniref:hypothetical protein n=1 Tax=Limnobacter sp. TaxID=2003368 RepID=UPI0032EE7CC6
MKGIFPEETKNLWCASNPMAASLLKIQLFVLIIICTILTQFTGYNYLNIAATIPLLILFALRLKQSEVFKVLIIVFTGTIAAIHTQSTTPIAYITPIIFLILSRKYTLTIKIKTITLIFYLMFLCSAIAAQLLLFGSVDGRWVGSWGDPNFAALWLITPLLFLLTIANQVVIQKKNILLLIKSIVLILSISISLATESRMALLALTVFYITNHLIKNNREKQARFIATLILIASIVGQYFLFFIFSDYINIGNTDNSNLFERTLNINDTSNLTRVSSAFHSINRIIESSSLEILFGQRYLFDELSNSGIHLAHNWFIQSVITNGLLVTSIICILITQIIKIGNKKIIPFVSSIMICASILSAVPIIYLFTFYAIATLISAPEKKESIKLKIMEKSTRSHE